MNQLSFGELFFSVWKFQFEKVDFFKWYVIIHSKISILKNKNGGNKKWQKLNSREVNHT